LVCLLTKGEDRRADLYPILVVDDEKTLREQWVAKLAAEGYAVDQAKDGLEAVQKLTEKAYPLLLCDVHMPEMDGHQVLEFIQSKELSTAVVLITAHGSIRNAIEAIRLGAFDYIEKPIREAQLIQIVQKAERAYQMLHKIKYSAPIVKSDKGTQEFVGESASMTRIHRLVERLAKVNTSVLIRGENGTGKELVAKGIHYNSPRKDQPFVAVNCAAIPETLIESELFGHEKGSFTGADSRKIGKFQFASKGTLFLDEIGDTPLSVQIKLLRVLQDQTFVPVGGNFEIKADVRIIAATNQDLEKLIKEGKFREDLFYRLNVMPIFLPPLRDRKVDIPGLVHHFISKFNQEHPNRIQGIGTEGLSMLENYRWPGNIRELENAIEHAFVLENSNQITIFSLPEYIRNATRRAPSFAPASPQVVKEMFHDLDWEKGKETFEREFILQALRSNSGRINLTAELSNIPKNTLLRKIKKYNISPKEYGGGGLQRIV